MRKEKSEMKYLPSTEIIYQDATNLLCVQYVANNNELTNCANFFYYRKNINDYKFIINSYLISDKFSDENIGFIPYIGYKKVDISIEYAKWLKNILNYLQISHGIVFKRELDEPFVWSLYELLVLSFKNQNTFYVTLSYGKNYELGYSYWEPSLTLSYTSPPGKIYFNLTNNFSKTYNYYTGRLEYVLYNSFYIYLRIKGFSFTINIWRWNFIDHPFHIYDSYNSITPRIYYSKGKFSFNFYSNIKLEKEFSYRLGMYLKYEFTGKRKILTAYNYYKAYNLNKITLKIK